MERVIFMPMLHYSHMGFLIGEQVIRHVLCKYACQ